MIPTLKVLAAPGAALACVALFVSLGSARVCAYQDDAKTPNTYVGSRACRKCHGDQHKSWKKTKMANIFDLLKPGERSEEKTKAGLDPDKDYTRDETCLPCHVTGWGKPGGYSIPPEGTTPDARKAQKAAKEMQGVQCEACHGPGSKTSAYKKQNKKYKFDEVEKAVGTLDGMILPTKEMCLVCHNTESPFVDKDYVFDFKKRVLEGTHDHYKLEFDHGCSHEHKVSEKKKKK